MSLSGNPSGSEALFTYGMSEALFRVTNVVSKNGRTSFTCHYNGDVVGDFEIGLIGVHNALNALSVIAVALDLGLDVKTIREGLAGFRGVGRRCERIGEEKGILVLDDYGHHPTEIKATLDAVQSLGRRMLVVFQPHRYTRTQFLWDEFGQSLARADEIFLTEIYSAGEPPIEGVSSELIAKAVNRHLGREAEIIGRFEDIPARVLSKAKKGDIILTLGAGDIYKAGRMIIEELKS